MLHILHLRVYILFVILLIVLGCNQPESNTVESTPTATHDQSSQSIIEAAIAVHGGEHLVQHDIQFDFRSRTYKSIREDGTFQYERLFQDTTGQQFRDVLTNDDFVRYINDEVVEITDERKNAYSNSVNSVIYFALLPYFLNDPAVQSKYLGQSTIKDVQYDKVMVTFQQEGGGKDYQDEFIYWFHKENHTLDYLAYNYLTDGGGSRFRRAFNPRVVEGVRFVDYVNYKHPDEIRDITIFDSLFQVGGLDSLSLIKTENIIVK